MCPFRIALEDLKVLSNAPHFTFAVSVSNISFDLVTGKRFVSVQRHVDGGGVLYMLATSFRVNCYTVVRSR